MGAKLDGIVEHYLGLARLNGWGEPYQPDHCPAVN
ncbi:unnamed protein product, partial [marine sediment metagenome]